MTRHLSIGACAALILLAGCGHQQTSAADATANTSDIATNAAAGLEHTAAVVPDAETANAVVNEATGIDNATAAGSNAVE